MRRQELKYKCNDSSWECRRVGGKQESKLGLSWNRAKTAQSGIG